MPSDPVEKTVGDFEYTFYPLKVLKGRKAYLRLAQLLSGSIGELQSNDKLTNDLIYKVLNQLINKLTEEDLEYFCNLLVGTCFVTGGSYGAKKPALKDVFDEHFEGAYDALVLWLVAGLQAQFASSFLGLLKHAKDAIKKTASPSTSPDPLTGTSGG